MADENLGLAVEDLSVKDLYGENAVMIELPASVDCTRAPVASQKLDIKLDAATVKKVAKIAVPVVAVLAVGVALSSNAKYAKQAKRRKQFYRWLG